VPYVTPGLRLLAPLFQNVIDRFQPGVYLRYIPLTLRILAFLQFGNVPRVKHAALNNAEPDKKLAFKNLLKLPQYRY
jgi:hypothetical protein